MTQDIINLVEQAKNGSERAFNKLYDKYYKTMWFTIYNIVKNRDVTEDLSLYENEFLHRTYFI